MRKIYEILRLKFDHDLSNREIALSVGASRTAIQAQVAKQA